MWQNFFLNEDGDKLSIVLAATGFNLRKMLQRLEAGAMDVFVYFNSKLNMQIINLQFTHYNNKVNVKL